MRRIAKADLLEWLLFAAIFSGFVSFVTAVATVFVR